MRTALVARCAPALAVLCSTLAWSADPLSVTQAVAWREVRSANSIGVRPGDFLKVGALQVTPNPFHGDNGSVGTSMLAYAPGSATGQPLLFVFSPASPNEFSSSRFAFSEAWADPWTLVVSNPESPNSPVTVTTPAVRRADGTIPPILPFVQDMSISGTGTNVTFHFHAPAGSQHNNIAMRIWDRNRLTPTGAVTLIYVAGLPASATSHTPPAILNADGDTLQVGGQYTVSIQLQESASTGVISRSVSYFNFSPLGPGSPPEAFLPIVGPDNVYNFSVSVQAGQTVFIDPAVAIGYEYATGAGDPNFASIVLPNVGDGLYEIQVLDAGAWQGRGVVSAGIAYFFGGAGVARFRVTGIETSAGLDPKNPSAFVSGLTFVAGGKFTGTMTPLVSPPDSTPPLVAATIEGAAGSNGWYRGPVSVAWNVVDNESAITSAACPATALSSETAGTTLACSASSSGGTATSSVTIRIDSTPPALTCAASPSVLWPPDNKLANISVAVASGDALSGAAGFALVSVTGNEPGSGMGSDDVRGWVLGTPDVGGQLRASRSGSGSGRVYTLTYRAMDVAGNSTTCSTTVTVPHDRGD